MPSKSAMDSKNFLDSYDLYIDAVENWKRWGTRVQELADLLSKDADYASILLAEEQTDIDAMVSASRAVSPAPLTINASIT